MKNVALAITMLTSRLIAIVVFAALLSAVPLQAALAQSAPDLGTAGSFAVLGGAAVTCTDSLVIGDVGVNLSGAITQTNCTISGTVHLGDLVAQKAYDDFLAAYAALAPASPPPPELAPCQFNLTGQLLAGQSLPPGVYCFNAAVAETGGVLTLDGPSDGIWIFKIGVLGTGALTGTNFTVVMTSGETCNNNVFWWTAEAANGFGLHRKYSRGYVHHRDPWELGRASPGEGRSDVD